MPNNYKFYEVRRHYKYIKIGLTLKLLIHRKLKIILLHKFKKIIRITNQLIKIWVKMKTLISTILDLKIK